MAASSSVQTKQVAGKSNPDPLPSLPPSPQVSSQRQVCHACGISAPSIGERCSECDSILPEIIQLKSELVKRGSRNHIKVSWKVSNSKEISLNSQYRHLAAEGEVVIDPKDEGLYTIELNAYQGSGQATSQVQVALRLPSISAFQADDAQISLDYPTIFSWNVQDAEYLEIDRGVGEVTGLSFFEKQLREPGKYVLTASNSLGTVQAEVKLSLPLPQLHNFFSSSYAIKLGLSNTLFWEANDAEELWLEPGHLDVKNHNRWEVAPDQSTTYELIAKNASGTTQQSLTLTLPPPKILYFGGDEISTEGEKVYLEWDVQNAHTVTLSHEVGEVPPCGEMYFRPRKPYTHLKLTAIGHSGTAYAEFTVVRFPIPLEIENIDSQFNKMIAMASKLPSAQDQDLETNDLPKVEPVSPPVSPHELEDPVFQRIQ
ncbi:MAG: hypothetical protein AAF804_20190, partial [Bacteroidota bacterium]